MISLELKISCFTASYWMDQLFTIPTQSWFQLSHQEIAPVVSRRSFCSLRHSSRWCPSLASSSSPARSKVRLFRKLKRNFLKNWCQLSKQTCKFGLFFNWLTSHVCHLSFKCCTYHSWLSGGIPIFHSWRTIHLWCLKSAKHQMCNLK